ncbi:MAG: META domain-containing protein, partial [Chloroflexi bacterium]|nr:META domain-containing protein [Chloroflexota bacterium]
ILETIDGQPPVAGTRLTLTIHGPRFGGFDGCNSFGGQHQSGTPVVEPDGSISAPPFAITAAGCPTDVVLDQANRYLEAMTQEARARVVDDHLHIVNDTGEVALAFAKDDNPVIVRRIELAGTGWRLVDRDGIYGERPTILVFLDDRAAVATSCRDYALGYTANAGRMRILYTRTAGSAEACSRDPFDRELLFIDDFVWANEYSTHFVQGVLRSLRMVVRTSRSKTLTFQPLPQIPPDAISDGQWTFIRSLEPRSGRSGMRWVEPTHAATGSDITAAFDESTVAGELGCNRYAYHATGGEGAVLVGPNGSMSLSEATLSTNNTCDSQADFSPHQRHYLDLLAAAERYHVFEDRLVIRTNTGDALMFRAEDSPPPTRPAPAGADYSIKDLEAWLTAVEEAAGRDSGIFMTSIDERNKRIQIRMRPLRGALERMEAAMATVGVPREAVVIEMGCDADGLSRFDKGESPNQAFLAAISYSLEAPSQVAYGETVHMNLTLRNISDEPSQFYMGGIPAHDFAVATADGENIWRWQCRQIILGLMGGETLEPGEELELSGQWEQVDHRGEPVPAGTYLIRGILEMEHPEKLVTPSH